MKGGSAMLVATIMSAFSSNPAVEASMLVTKPSVICKEDCVNTDVLVSLEARKDELYAILKDFRQHYYDLCYDVESIDLNQYENLKSLELTSRGMSEYMKGILSNEAESIKIEYGENVYESFRHLVATYNQLRKNISNVLALFEDKRGKVETLNNTEFEPTIEFITAAYSASEAIYNNH